VIGAARPIREHAGLIGNAVAEEKSAAALAG